MWQKQTDTIQHNLNPVKVSIALNENCKPQKDAQWLFFVEFERENVFLISFIIGFSYSSPLCFKSKNINFKVDVEFTF